MRQRAGRDNRRPGGAPGGLRCIRHRAAAVPLRPTHGEAAIHAAGGHRPRPALRFAYRNFQRHPCATIRRSITGSGFGLHGPTGWPVGGPLTRAFGAGRDGADASPSGREFDKEAFLTAAGLRWRAAPDGG